MNTKNKTRFWVRIMCWILIAMMILGGFTYVIYALAGLL